MNLSPAALRQQCKNFAKQFGPTHPRTLSSRAVLGNVLIQTQNDPTVREGILECKTLIDQISDLRIKHSQHATEAMNTNTTMNPEQQQQQPESSGPHIVSQEATLLRLQHHAVKSLLAANKELVENYDYYEAMKKNIEGEFEELSKSSGWSRGANSKQNAKGGKKAISSVQQVMLATRPEYKRMWARDKASSFGLDVEKHGGKAGLDWD
eukprot:PhF_6_TR9903/c0_g1_i1/m.15095